MRPSLGVVTLLTALAAISGATARAQTSSPSFAATHTIKASSTFWMVVSPDGQWILTRGMSAVSVYGIATGKQDQQRMKHDSCARCAGLAISDDGKVVAALIWSSRQIAFTGFGSNKMLHAVSQVDGTSEELAFLPGSTTRVFEAGSGPVRLWDSNRSGSPLRSYAPLEGSATVIAVSQDGVYLAGGGSRGLMWIWRVADAKLLSTMNGHTAEVTSLSFSRDGKTLASASEDGTVRVWDTATGHPRRTIAAAHAGGATSVAVAPDGKHVASGGKDKTVKLWSVATGQLAQTLSGHTEELRHVRFTGDGQTLVSATNGTIRVWSRMQAGSTAR